MTELVDQPREETKAAWILLVVIFALIAAPIAYTLWSKIPSAEEQTLLDAEERVMFLEVNGATRDELCEAKRAVQEAHLQLRNGEGYRRAKLYADTSCRAADLGL